LLICHCFSSLADYLFTAGSLPRLTALALKFNSCISSDKMRGRFLGRLRLSHCFAAL
jgi:hypothetical protein